MVTRILDILQQNKSLIESYTYFLVFTAVVLFAFAKAYSTFKVYADKINMLSIFFKEKRIKELLKKYNSKLLGDRLMLFRFHDGEKGINSIHFLKVSATNEVVREGVRMIGSYYKALFIGNYPEWFEKIIEGEEILYKDVKKEVTDESAKNFIKYMGAYSIIELPLVINGAVIGYISLQFCRPIDTEKTNNNYNVFNKATKELYELKGILEILLRDV